ncbi:MAG TPA: MFS transporter, partial [Gaiellaceae bacterium]
MRKLLVLVGAIVWVDTMFFAALTPLLPHYADEFGLGKAGAGLLQAAYPAGTFIAAVPSGIVAARLGVKRTVLVGLGTLAATSLAFGFADALLRDGQGPKARVVYQRVLEIAPDDLRAQAALETIKEEPAPAPAPPRRSTTAMKKLSAAAAASAPRRTSCR